MESSLAAIVPAAGLSRRMGSPKPLLSIADTTAIERIVDLLLAAGIPPVVVLGPTGGPVAEILEGRRLQIVWNLAPEADMASSIRTGLGFLPAEATGVLVWLVDHPLVAPSTVSSLANLHRQFPEKIVIPRHQGRNGHPVLVPRAILAELAHRPTLRDVVRFDRGRISFLEVADLGVFQDLDTPEEYQQALAQWTRC